MKIVPTGDRRILHVEFDTQYEVCSTFVRLQEFYESPFGNIRGKVFTLDEFMDTYARNNEGVFSYFEDWAGFNVPGSAIVDFVGKYNHLRLKEKFLIDCVRDVVGLDSTDFYLIGTYINEKGESAIEHEVAHAFYYLDNKYRETCDEIFMMLPAITRAKISLRLLEIGYTESVIKDEAQAYFATSDIEYLVKLFGLTEAEFDKHAYAEFQTVFHLKRTGVN